jgi:hypothetical protein
MKTIFTIFLSFFLAKGCGSELNRLAVVLNMKRCQEGFTKPLKLKIKNLCGKIQKRKTTRGFNCQKKSGKN